MRQLILLVSMVGCAFFSTANGGELWQGAELGMTPTEILNEQEGARRVQDGEHLGSGAQELVRLSGVVLFDEPFDAEYYFKDRKLVQVTLSASNEISYGKAKSKFIHLKEALTAKYGSPYSEESLSGFLKKRSASWLDGSRNISALALSVGNADAVLNVVYQERIAKEMDKL